MLKFTWIAKHTGAPASESWQAASDVLYLGAGDGDPQVQSFARGGWAGPVVGDALAKAAADWVAGLGGRTAVVMVHGWNYDPREDGATNPDDDPYQLVFGPPNPAKPGESWLPLIDDSADGARAVGFAWTSIGTQWQAGNAGWSNFYQYPVLDLAPLAARALATIIVALRQAGATVDLLAHSLGTRTTVQALSLLGQSGHGDAIGRAVLLGGAEYCCDAQAALAVAQPEVFNLANRDDPVLTLGAEQMCHPYRPNGDASSRVIGRQGVPNGGWTDVQLNRADVAAWYAANGYPDLSGQPCDGRGEHWAYYHQPGNRRLITDLLSHRIGVAQMAPAPLNKVSPNDYTPCAVPPTPPDAATRIAMNDPNPQPAV